MVILSDIVYNNIIDFLRNYKGLAIECEEQLAKKFPDIQFDTLKSIMSKHGQNLIKTFFSKNHKKAPFIVRE
jgi:hypothetical protein